MAPVMSTVSSFLTAHQHIKGYFMPSRLLWKYSGNEGDVATELLFMSMCVYVCVCDVDTGQ